MSTQRNIPLDLVHLLPLIDKELISLLKSLTAEEWEMQTIAKKWKVKDVVAHLLDGNIRSVSMLRDGYHGESANINTYQDLLDFLNGLNADWVKAMKRVSPAMLVLLHEATGKAYCDYYASLDPFDKAGFAVNWAGENESKNWMHIAREYTEKWLHQQQIRDAVKKPGILTREFYYPFIQTFMMGLPYTYHEIAAKENSTVQVTVTGDAGGSWFLKRKNNEWILNTGTTLHPTAEMLIEQDLAWKLFSKSLRPADVRGVVTIHGDRMLGEKALEMVSVMA